MREYWAIKDTGDSSNQWYHGCHPPLAGGVWVDKSRRKRFHTRRDAWLVLQHFRSVSFFEDLRLVHVIRKVRPA
jgi:hypothetical protein